MFRASYEWPSLAASMSPRHHAVGSFPSSLQRIGVSRIARILASTGASVDLSMIPCGGCEMAIQTAPCTSIKSSASAPPRRCVRFATWGPQLEPDLGRLRAREVDSSLSDASIDRGPRRRSSGPMAGLHAAPLRRLS